MRLVLDFVERLSNTERQAVLGGTAQRFWNLQTRES
jgi:predicted TIM-barrel fold metal-dependent hydrolase